MRATLPPSDEAKRHAAVLFRCAGIAMVDAEGTECIDLSEAHKIAASYAGKLLQEAPERFWQEGDWTVSVRDECGLQLFSIVIMGLPAPALQS